jgi:hypothetical protein
MEENKRYNSIEHIKKNLAKKLNSGNEENSDFQESKFICINKKTLISNNFKNFINFIF